MAKKRKTSPVPFRFRGLELDEFQKQAIWYLQRNTSTLVCAPTGTGKTLIADYLVDITLKQEKRVIFTAPIKALVNQKYQEFSRRFGRERVGIVTGDVSENKHASLVVMTTEVYRNMLLRGEPHPDIQWVIFDEIHYLDHPERGTVWEEAIMLVPRSVGILGLSATIPNAQEIAAWIETVHRPIAVVSHTKRAVPLAHLYFNERTQAVTRDELLSTMLSESFDAKGGTLQFDNALFSRIRPGDIDSTRHLDLIHYVVSQRGLPCLYFVFSRRGCEEKAAQLAHSANFLNAHEKRAIEVTVRKTLEERGIKREDVPRLAAMEAQWAKGIGVHHAGLLPVVKEIVEQLLSRKLLRVLYVTETFAVGVNMPVRTVCFDSLRKYDGKRWRLLTQQEYFQMAGRAGRRGLDRQGTVISLVDSRDLNRELPPEWEDSRLEPVTSKMNLSFNAVVNLLARTDLADIRSLFSKTLASYQYQKRKQAGTLTPLDVDPVDKLWADFRQKLELLSSLGFVSENTLTAKGETCRGIFVQEVLVTELLWQGVFDTLTVDEIGSLLASIVYEEKPDDQLRHTYPQSWLPAVTLVIDRLRRADAYHQLQSISLRPEIGQVVADWIRGTKMRTLMRRYPISEGDFVTTCRRTIDLTRQILSAYTDPALKQKLELCIQSLDRDVVRVHL